MKQIRILKDISIFDKVLEKNDLYEINEFNERIVEILIEEGIAEINQANIKLNDDFILKFLEIQNKLLNFYNNIYTCKCNYVFIRNNAFDENIIDIVLTDGGDSPNIYFVCFYYNKNNNFISINKDIKNKELLYKLIKIMDELNN